MATWDEYVKFMRAWLDSTPLPTPTRAEVEAEGMFVTLEDTGLTLEEANEQIVMVCLQCGDTRECRLGDFHGDLPGDTCCHCGGLVVEDRKGKPLRRMAKDDKWN